MFDDLLPEDLAIVAIVAVVVAILLAFLANGKLRTSMIVVWALMPVWLIMWVTTLVIYNEGFELFSLSFALFFIIFSMPPWLLLTVFPFKLVSSLRRINSEF